MLAICWAFGDMLALRLTCSKLFVEDTGDLLAFSDMLAIYTL